MTTIGLTGDQVDHSKLEMLGLSTSFCSVMARFVGGSTRRRQFCPRIVDYVPAVDLFAYTPYADVLFEDWQAFSKSDHYPKSQKWEDGYLEGNTRLVLCSAFWLKFGYGCC